MDDLLVVGPGAIGCAFAAAGFESGQRVAVAGRTPFEELHVEFPHGAMHRRVQVVTDVEAVRPARFVALATKAPDTAAAAALVRAALTPESVVVVLQNGVTHVERLEPLLPVGASVLPAVVNCPAERSAPGCVEVTGRALFSVPAGGAGDALAGMVATPSVTVATTPDWLTSAWTKLMINAATGAVAAVARTDNGVFLDPEAAELAIALMGEVAEVGRAEGASLASDLPQRMLDVLRERAIDHMSSIVVDRLAGRPTEWRERNQVVVERAGLHGIDVPITRLTALMLRLGEPGGPGHRPPT